MLIAAESSAWRQAGSELEGGGNAISASRVGVILRTEKYEDSVRFYQDILGLEVWYAKPELVCFRFGAGYLMVERDGRSSRTRKGSDQSPHILRFDVPDVRSTAKSLTARGMEVELLELEWGTIAAFADPDGNPCELKNDDDPFFA